MDKVGHTVLQKGQVLKSPSGDKDWVVIDNGEDDVVKNSLYPEVHEQKLSEINGLV